MLSCKRVSYRFRVFVTTEVSYMKKQFFLVGVLMSLCVNSVSARFVGLDELAKFGGVVSVYAQDMAVQGKECAQQYGQYVVEHKEVAAALAIGVVTGAVLVKKYKQVKRLVIGTAVTAAAVGLGYYFAPEKMNEIVAQGALLGSSVAEKATASLDKVTGFFASCMNRFATRA